MARERSSSADESARRPAPRAAPGHEQAFRDLRAYVPRDILDVSFPVAVRGYDRGAVDAYVRRVNRVIAELKVTGSPPAAVRHALEQAEDKVQGLLGAAREAAEEMTASAQREAQETTARAKAEAQELVVNADAEATRTKAESDELLARARREADGILAAANAEAAESLANARAEAQSTVARAQAEAEQRLRQSEEELAGRRKEAETQLGAIQAHTDAVRTERTRLLDEIRHVAARLVEFADTASAYSDRRDPALREEANAAEPDRQPGSEDAAPDDVTRIVPPAAPGRAGDTRRP